MSIQRAVIAIIFVALCLLAPFLFLSGPEQAVHADFIVPPSTETDEVPDDGDAADDIAIWLHPIDPSLSVVVGTNKDNSSNLGGLYVYDRTGHELSNVTGSRLNSQNVFYAKKKTSSKNN